MIKITDITQISFIKIIFIIINHNLKKVIILIKINRYINIKWIFDINILLLLKLISKDTYNKTMIK